MSAFYDRIRRHVAEHILDPERQLPPDKRPQRPWCGTCYVRYLHPWEHRTWCVNYSAKALVPVRKRGLRRREKRGQSKPRGGH